MADPWYIPLFSGRYMIWRECCQMVLWLVTVCWCRANRYKPYKWTLFRILNQNRVQKIIQWYDNNIWKHMRIKKLCYSTYTYLRYYAQRGNPGWNIHVSSISRIGPIPTKWEFVLLCTREWYRRGNLELEPVTYINL